MPDPTAIPRAAIPRMAFYLRQLERMDREGVQTVSSAQLGEAIGASDAQVRKDLAYFGQFGQRGVGYNVIALIRTLRSRLDISQADLAQLVGVSAVAVGSWESGKSRPRPETKARIVALRALGRREVRRLLAKQGT